ncbi:MAG TPA: YwbE family protein [Methanocorpusculum sp.]|nr:YwbE family protein [Methanocorpusculum sp.]HJK14149.1 YwbE family protein [Methanocorpusculum sp.]HJK18511.1 YwbE family protein [Methanocorpusculum sp.]HJK21699.1 YwbE family protein [Methanocorpusculum sp.]HJK26465.1 YwbE family protein [Methanocorpusculum sp.]
MSVESMQDGRVRRNIHVGSAVAIVLKKDQPTGALTWGRVAEILTNSPSHPHGIKVRLSDGSVGRVQQIYDK